MSDKQPSEPGDTFDRQVVEQVKANGGALSEAVAKMQSAVETLKSVGQRLVAEEAAKEPPRGGSVFEDWLAVFPGKMGLHWACFGDSRQSYSRERVETVVAGYCNGVAIPKKLFEHLQEQYKIVAEYNALKVALNIAMEKKTV